MPLNIEIKARCNDPAATFDVLKSNGALHKGRDHQVDTYFNVSEGRLKLREGSIENNLIFYKRENQAGPKRSDVILYPAAKGAGLKEILTSVLGVKVVVDKFRDIFFIDNVKFHIDKVAGLGNFCEIEAIGETGHEETLHAQCRHFMDLLGIADEDLVVDSYSDLLLNINGQNA